MSCKKQQLWSERGQLNPEWHWFPADSRPGIAVTKQLAGSHCLTVTPKPLTDFWKRTYYNPPINKHNGHIFGCKVPQEANFRLQCAFTLQARNQFDQAGLIVFADPDHWVKAGIEYVDGVPR
eukprot:g5721.t1